MADGYKFPHELEEENAEKPEDNEGFEVEVEDDTPALDRGRKVDPKPPEDPTEDELASYDEKVQARIKKFTRGYHDERRAKEEALREREAAENLAKQLWEKNRTLQQQVELGSRAYIEQSKTSAEMEFEKAKKEFKEAYESGDADAVAEAQAKIARATLNMDKVSSFKPIHADENEVQTPQRNTNQAPVSQQDAEWQRENTWFGTDEEMTAAALGLHQKLIRQKGINFVGSKEYYKIVDATMRKRFSDYFDGDGSYEDDTTSKQVSEPAEEETPRRATKPSTVVAPAARSTPPNRIRLKASEAAIARRLGVPLEEYAKQVAQLKRGN